MAVAPLSETAIIKINNVTMTFLFLNECFQFKNGPSWLLKPWRTTTKVY